MWAKIFLQSLALSLFRRSLILGRCRITQRFRVEAEIDAQYRSIDDIPFFFFSFVLLGALAYYRAMLVVIVDFPSN